jgi:serine/threonine protein phosphatase PrpC
MSRYLWAVGESAATFNAGDVLADRYRCKGPRIFLDEKPALLPGNLDEIPEFCIPYLKLSPNQLHVPQVYDWIQFASGDPTSTLLLLDQAPLCEPKVLAKRGIILGQHATVGKDMADVQLLPKLEEMWSAASALRQLNWLWQLANLWYPMNAEGVASSLLNLDLLRVEGPILRLRELQFDDSTVSLAALGKFLSPVVKTARPEIQAPLQQLCQDLSRGVIRNAETLLEQIDGSIASLGRSQQTREIHISTLSDQGPSRARNEDACYPESGTHTTVPPADPLVIVCDGIGGHQGGDVASNLAIKTLEQQVKALDPEQLNAVALEMGLERAVGTANDSISQQNDQEQRFDRQRMGTTVVMALVRSHELYITHVGDSRAYLITRWGCHQITQDDDVASREVRLGYSSYPQALQQPSAGSLVQALGMGSANNLYPTVQRFILDDDSVFLLCSDGLSDNDQVEKHWDSVILPLLSDRVDLETVSKRLIEIANTQNGYDNSTVGIIHCKVTGAKTPSLQTTAQTTTTLQSAASRTRAVAPVTAGAQTTHPSTHPSELQPSSLSTTIPTQRIEQPKPSKRQSSWSLILGILLLASIAAAIVALLMGPTRLFRLPNSSPVTSADPPTPSPANSPSDRATPSSPSSAPREIEPIFTEPLQASTNIAVASSLVPNQQQFDRQIATGSIVREASQKDFQGERWVELQVCDVSAAVPADEPVTDGSPDVVPDVPDSAQFIDSTGFNRVQKAQKQQVLTEPQNLSSGEAGWIPIDRYQASLGSDLRSDIDPTLKAACGNSSPLGSPQPDGNNPTNAQPEAETSPVIPEEQVAPDPPADELPPI